MTEEIKQKLYEINDRLEFLEHHQRFAEADALILQECWILDYDSKGNWIGPVANENGWTP